MAEPDLSSLNDQERATFWTGAIVRNTMLLEVTLRTILRSLGRKHPADPVPDEPVEFEALRLAVATGIQATFDGELAREIGDVLDEVDSVRRSGIGVLDALWGVLEGSDVFQVLDLLPTDPEQRTPAVRVSEQDFQALRLAQVRAYLRLGGVEKVVRHASYDAPFDTDADRLRRHAQVRGEFEVRSDGAMVFSDAALVERDVAREG
jgi:hypothetical protein